METVGVFGVNNHLFQTLPSLKDLGSASQASSCDSFFRMGVAVWATNFGPGAHEESETKAGRTEGGWITIYFFTTYRGYYSMNSHHF